MQIPGLVNVDFADVKAVMKNSGTAMLGVGVSSSKNRAQEAAEQATLAPLIGSSIDSYWRRVQYHWWKGHHFARSEQSIPGASTFPLMFFQKFWEMKKCWVSSSRFDGSDM